MEAAPVRGPVAPILKAAPVGSTTSFTKLPEAVPVVSPAEALALEPPALLALPPLPPQAARDSVMAAAMVKARNFLLFMSCYSFFQWICAGGEERVRPRARNIKKRHGI